MTQVARKRESADFSKVVRIGKAPRVGNVFCKIEYSDGRLSIRGVEGPISNGDARGGCGQIDMSIDADYIAALEYAPGWDRESVTRFVEVWGAWHLNDMRAGCEHQRKIDTTRQVEVVSYKLTYEASKLRTDTLAAAAKAQLTGGPFNPTPTAKALALLDKWFADRHEPPDADSPLSGCFEVAKREQKAIGWVRPDEHPDGMLCKPCEVCGYKYGSQWLREEVPADVLAWLAALPETDIKPAWV